MQLEQTFWQRILHTGSLQVSTAGKAHMEIAVIGIPDPDEVKEIIDRDKRESND